MYAGAAEMQNFRPMDGELRRWFPGDVGGYDSTMCNLIYSAPPSEYDVGDLFNAPEPIIEEPILELDPVTAAICMMSNCEDVISAEAMKVEDIESIRNEHLFSEVFYDCKKELLEKSAIKDSFPEPPNYKLPAVHVEDDPGIEMDSSVSGGQLQKSVSSGCLKLTEWTQDSPVKLKLDGLHEVNLEDAYGIRRTYSEGDIHTLRNCRSSLGDKATVHSSFEQLELRDLKIEEKLIENRKEKIDRYMRKKTRRNFGRKIKYACRKALADSQPRVRGRFAKSEVCEASAKLPAHADL
ncbi:zinc finger protein CONSTANS-LIKE 6-like [Phalaenopsis equestris]|uniref:zinc finger protein CONSTANS-LIKE 6-like n=1 Tax=Phalaenopsis equestris TaxID=78828 RepID=UPI0009E51453|nr:zinc finger protein CONSTANS-LIKE 6-like [Phalaenopsis equestris]